MRVRHQVREGGVQLGCDFTQSGGEGGEGPGGGAGGPGPRGGSGRCLRDARNTKLQAHTLQCREDYVGTGDRPHQRRALYVDSYIARSLEVGSLCTCA